MACEHRTGVFHPASGTPGRTGSAPQIAAQSAGNACRQVVVDAEAAGREPPATASFVTPIRQARSPAASVRPRSPGPSGVAARARSPPRPAKAAGPGHDGSSGARVPQPERGAGRRRWASTRPPSSAKAAHCGWAAGGGLPDGRTGVRHRPAAAPRCGGTAQAADQSPPGRFLWASSQAPTAARAA